MGSITRRRGGIIRAAVGSAKLTELLRRLEEDRREVIMIMSEYEERFRSPTRSLHQIFAEARLTGDDGGVDDFGLL